MIAAPQTKKTEQKAAPVLPGTPRPCWPSALELIVVSLLCIAALETGFAWGGIGEQEYLKPDPVAGFVIMPGKNITFRREGFSRTHFNSLGMADRERTLDKLPGTFRIAVLGDSIIEALQVDQDKTMCSLLEKSLKQRCQGKNIEVLNFAVGAYNLGQMYIRLKTKVLDFKPDLLVLFMRHHSTYDVIPQAKECFPKASRPYFFVGEGGRLIEDHYVMNHWASSPEGKRLKSCGWLREHSHIWGAVSKIIEAAENWRKQMLAGQVHWGADLSNKQTAFAQAQNNNTNNATQVPEMSANKPGSLKVTSLANKPRSAGVLLASSPDATTGSSMQIAAAPNPEAAFTRVSNGDSCIRCYYPVVNAIITAMDKECRQHGSNFCLAYMPAHDSAAQLEHTLTRNTADTLNIPYLDLGEDLSRAKRESSESIYFVCHFSQRGNAVLAKALESKLSELACLKKL